jgi:membrane protein YqaA with SNARE-associated domain
MTRAVALLCLLIAKSATADVIFPAFAAPYITAVLFPYALVAIPVAEAFVYKMYWRQLSIWVVALLAICANATSSLIGWFIAYILPSGLVVDPRNHMLSSGPHFGLYALLGFVVAYLLSIAIEGAVLRGASHWVSLNKAFKVSFAANTVSYALLGIIALVN